MHDMSAAADNRKQLIARIEGRIRELDTNPRAVSVRAGLGVSAVHDIITDRNKRPSVPTIRAIARALEVDFGYLTGDQDTPRSNSDDVMAGAIRVVGDAEAGAFRVMSDFTAELETDAPVIHAPFSKRHPKAKHWALKVRGDSMNATKPFPILEGMYVLCVDMSDADLSVDNGEIYAVRRTMDGGQTYESTIKRARVFRDRVELVPESTNPTHKPFVIPRTTEVEAHHEIQAIGWVYGTFHSFERT